MATRPPDDTTPVVTIPEVPLIEHQPDPLNFDPVDESDPSTGQLIWRGIPLRWASYQPIILDATDFGTIVPVGIDRGGYTILIAAGVAHQSVHPSDEDGMYLYQPMTSFTMFDGAVGSNASNTATATTSTNSCCPSIPLAKIQVPPNSPTQPRRRNRLPSCWPPSPLPPVPNFWHGDDALELLHRC